MTDGIRTRLEAVERAVTDGETDLSAVDDAVTLDARLTAVEERLTAVEDQLADLDATTQAVRGYLSGVDGVTDDVERQAALALAKAERVETRVFETDEGLSVERLPASMDGARPDESPAGQPPSNDPLSSDRPTGDTRPAESQPQNTSLVTRLRDVL